MRNSRSTTSSNPSSGRGRAGGGGSSFLRSISGTRKPNSGKSATAPRGASQANQLSTERSAQLWGAVALQQHLARSIAMPTLPKPPPARPGQLTLAQKMGLAERPPPAPTDEDWTKVVDTAAGRHEACKPCAICMEAFFSTAAQPQIILTCSHVFHANCLKQFEKFVRRAGDDVKCPTCRATNYHKRVHYEGAAQAQVFAITKIQSVVRGFLGRRRFLRMRLKADPKFHSDYCYGKLRDTADGYLAYAVSREQVVDKFLEDLDLTRQRAVASMFNKEDWDKIRHQVLSRHDELECPICMAGFPVQSSSEAQNESPDDGGATGESSGGGGAAANHEAMMLSCGHCFHAPCIAAFERVSSHEIPRCPVCRAGYLKVPL